MTPSANPEAVFDGQVQGAPAPPPPDNDFPEVNTPAWDVMNRRRCELIRKLEGEGLSEKEQAEYERLQRGAVAAVDKAFPGPTRLNDELARIEARIAAQEAKGGS